MSGNQHCITYDMRHNSTFTSIPYFNFTKLLKPLLNVYKTKSANNIYILDLKNILQFTNQIKQKHINEDYKQHNTYLDAMKNNLVW